MLNSRQILQLIYNSAMKKFYNVFLIFCVVFFSALASQAEEYKILVLPDNIQFDSTNYLIYPDSSTIFASDIINAMKKDGRVETVSMTKVRDAMRKNTKLSILTKKALKEFKYNYNIPFVDFKEIADCFGTDKVLIITSQTDVQNYFLRRTLWDFLNIPGATVINPGYKLSTYVALIDVNKEYVIWQNTYYKTIGAMENRMVALNFAPATEQLEKIKSYSSYYLSPSVALAVQSRILPAQLLNPQMNPQVNPIVEVSNVKPLEQVENFSKEDMILKPKVYVPARQKSDDYGMVINEL